MRTINKALRNEQATIENLRLFGTLEDVENATPVKSTIALAPGKLAPIAYYCIEDGKYVECGQVVEEKVIREDVVYTKEQIDELTKERAIILESLKSGDEAKLDDLPLEGDIIEEGLIEITYNAITQAIPDVNAIDPTYIIDGTPRISKSKIATHYKYPNLEGQSYALPHKEFGWTKTPTKGKV